MTFSRGDKAGLVFLLAMIAWVGKFLDAITGAGWLFASGFFLVLAVTAFLILALSARLADWVDERLLRQPKWREVRWPAPPQPGLRKDGNDDT